VVRHIHPHQLHRFGTGVVAGQCGLCRLVYRVHGLPGHRVLPVDHRGPFVVWDRESVAAYLSAPDEIQRKALSPERSLKLIKEMAKGMDTE
jgi:hypothetical protein